jgi:hypothetical protein
MANNHHDYEEVHLHDDDAEDIELVSGGGDGRHRRSTPPPSSSSSSSSPTKWIIILFLIVLVGVYKLGMEEGKAEVQHEGGDVEMKKNQQQQQHENNQAAAQEEQIKIPDTTTTTTTTTTSPTKPPMKFTMDQLNFMRTECHKLINLLDNYYFGKDKAIAMLMNSYVGPWNFDEVSIDNHEESTSETMIGTSSPRKLRATKLVNTMLRALVTDSQETFLMGGIGSSVMAGHDNW